MFPSGRWLELDAEAERHQLGLHVVNVSLGQVEVPLEFVIKVARERADEVNPTALEAAVGTHWQIQVFDWNGGRIT